MSRSGLGKKQLCVLGFFFIFLVSFFVLFFVYVCATFSPLVASHFICDFLAFEQRLFCLTWMLTVSHQMYTPEIFSCQRKDEFSIFLCKLYFGLSCFLICEDLRGCKTRKGLLQCSLCACVGKDRHSECVSLLVTPHTRTHTHTLIQTLISYICHSHTRVNSGLKVVCKHSECVAIFTGTYCC